MLPHHGSGESPKSELRSQVKSIALARLPADPFPRKTSVRPVSPQPWPFPCPLTSGIFYLARTQAFGMVMARTFSTHVVVRWRSCFSNLHDVLGVATAFQIILKGKRRPRNFQKRINPRRDECGVETAYLSDQGAGHQLTQPTGSGT